MDKARKGIEEIISQSNNESDKGWQNYHELILLIKNQGWMKTLNMKLFAIFSVLLDKEKGELISVKKNISFKWTVLPFTVNTFTVANNSHSMISKEGSLKMDIFNQSISKIQLFLHLNSWVYQKGHWQIFRIKVLVKHCSMIFFLKAK